MIKQTTKNQNFFSAKIKKELLLSIKKKVAFSASFAPCAIILNHYNSSSEHTKHLYALACI